MNARYYQAMASDFEISQGEAHRAVESVRWQSYHAKRAARKATGHARKAGRFMADLRRMAAVSRKQLAEELGVTRDSLRMWETGLDLYPMSVAERAARALVDWHAVSPSS